LGGGGFDEKRKLCRFVILELSYKILNKVECNYRYRFIIDTFYKEMDMQSYRSCNDRCESLRRDPMPNKRSVSLD